METTRIGMVCIKDAASCLSRRVSISKSLMFIKNNYLRNDSAYTELVSLGCLQNMLNILSDQFERYGDLILSVLAKSSASYVIQNWLYDNGGIKAICDIMKKTEVIVIKHRACQIIGNLAKNNQCADFIYEEPGFYLCLIDHLKAMDDSGSILVYLWTMRIIATKKKYLELMTENNALQAVSAHLISTNHDVTIAALETLKIITKFITPKLVSDMGGCKMMTQLMEVISEYPKKIQNKGYNLLEIHIKNVHIREHFLTENGIAYILKRIKTTYIVKEKLTYMNLLCICCRDLCSPRELLEALPFMVNALNDKQYSILHKRIISSFTYFIYNTDALSILIQNNVINALLDHWDKLLSLNLLFSDENGYDWAKILHKYFIDCNSKNDEKSCNIPPCKKLKLDKDDDSDTDSVSNDFVDTSFKYSIDSPTYKSIIEWAPITEHSLNVSLGTFANPMSSFPITTISDNVSCSPHSSRAYSPLSNASFVTTDSSNADQTYSDDDSTFEFSDKDSPTYTMEAQMPCSSQQNTAYSPITFQNEDSSSDSSHLKSDNQIQNSDAGFFSEKIIKGNSNKSSGQTISNIIAFIYNLCFLPNFNHLLYNERLWFNIIHHICISPSLGHKYKKLMTRLINDPINFELLIIKKIPILVYYCLSYDYFRSIQKLQMKKLNKCYVDDVNSRISVIVNERKEIFEAFRFQAESRFGESTFMTLLSRGPLTRRIDTSAVIPFIIRSYKILKTLLADYGGLEYLLQFIFENGNDNAENNYVFKSLFKVIKNFHFSIKSKIHCKRKDSYCKKEDNFDVEFLLDDGKVIPACRQFMGKFSPMFKAMLEGDFIESNKSQIDLHEVNSAAFQCIVDYIHKETFHFLDEDLEDIFIILDKFLISIDLSNEIIENYLNLDTLIHVLEVSMSQNIERLYSEALNLMFSVKSYSIFCDLLRKMISLNLSDTMSMFLNYLLGQINLKYNSLK